MSEDVYSFESNPSSFSLLSISICSMAWPLVSCVCCVLVPCCTGWVCRCVLFLSAPNGLASSYASPPSRSSSFRLLRSEIPAVCFYLGNMPYGSGDTGLTISVPNFFSAPFPVDIAAESGLTACKTIWKRWCVFVNVESIVSVVLM